MLQKSSLCIALIAALISSGICCTSQEWKCVSGECIALDQLCDGNIECADGSDEKADSCIQQKCPEYAFRCAYGACVSGTAECNNIQECADNSDENSVKCSSNNPTQRVSKCLSEQFECESGECINQDSACDGHSDCPDQSDESLKVCASNNCPPFAFRCGYGACISSSKKCNGEPDCRDGSDEASNLCGTLPSMRPTDRPTKRPPMQPPRITTPPPVLGCKAPKIPNGRLVYESDDITVIRPGEIVAELVSIVYKCSAGYSRVGLNFNLCTASGWREAARSECIKFCPHSVLKGDTFRADCERDGASVPCDDHIKPKTRAKLTCKVKYEKPDRNPPDVLLCQDDGQWDYQPFRCEQICGEEPTQVTPFIVNGEKTNITSVPWHVGIFENFSGRFKHECGGTIINAKVVVSAAHCFWDVANEVPYDKSYYAVGAGKYYRDYYNTNDRSAQFRNISKIVIPPEFKGATENYRADIAVLVLTDFLRFSPFIAPICIKWEWGAAQSMPSNRYGRIAGWGIDESGDFSNELRTIDVATSSFDDCRSALGPTWGDTITNDKFCVINTSGAVVCSGDSGGGFTIKKVVGGKNIYYFGGIVSGGVPQNSKCAEYSAVSYTNVQYFQPLISNHESSNRPR